MLVQERALLGKSDGHTEPPKPSKPAGARFVLET